MPFSDAMRLACSFLSSAMVSGLCSYIYPVAESSARDCRNRSLGLILYRAVMVVVVAAGR
jgi:hypothetical protein